MTITGVRFHLLSYRYAPEEVWSWPGGVYRGWTSAFVELSAEDGSRGFGEIGDGLNTPELIRPMVDRAATIVTGCAARPRAVLERLTRAAPGWGHGGLFQSVISGFEAATFDLLGRRLGVPVTMLLGGAVRDRLPVYASGGLAEDPEAIGTEVAGYVRDGFRAVKIRIGFGIGADLRRVEAAREALGDDGELLLDLGASYLPEPPDLRTVVRLWKAIAHTRPYWLEDPLPREDISGLARLRAEIDTRIAAGENERTPDHVRRLLDAQAVDVVQTDAVYAGGILRQLEIAAVVEAAGARLAPHTWCSGPGLMANVAVVACARAALMVELPRVPNPLRERTLVQPILIEDGCIAAPVAPGLGVSFDDEVLGWSHDPQAAPILHNAAG